MTTKNKNCFVEVSNNDIYKEILSIQKELSKQNGKIKLNTWLGSTALTFCLAILCLLKVF